MTDAVPNYAELPLGRFMDMVASREPTPGGGASAAVAVALAAALTAMAARFSADHGRRAARHRPPNKEAPSRGYA